MAATPKYYMPSTHNEDQVAYLRRKNAYWLAEPALTIRVGYDFLKLQLQLGKSFNLSHADFKQDEDYLTLGFYLDM
mgnify:CR=1 FL=1